MAKIILAEQARKIDKNLKHTHPNKILKELLKLIKDVGGEVFLKGAGYNKQRDLLKACLFAYAIRSFVKEECYIGESIQDPPDFTLLTPSERQIKDKPFTNANVEIVDIPIQVDREDNKIEYAKNILLSTKLNNYKPEQGTMMLIFINSVSGELLKNQLREWYGHNKDRFKNFGEIFTMFLVRSDAEKGLVFKVCSLTSGWKSELCLTDEVCKKLINHKLLEKYGFIID